MKPIEPIDLANVLGGINLDNLPASDNIEDRRGLSRRDSLRPRPLAPVQPPLPHTPGDLASQAGLDDIRITRRRR